MSVAVQTPYNVLTGDGASTSFTYPFQILLAADIAVYVGSALKVLNSDYTVTGAGVQTGGAVVFTTPPANGATVTLTRKMAKQRLTDYQQAGDFLTAVVNPDFDRSILMIQELDAALARSIRVQPYEQSSAMILPSKASRASSYLFFDANGDVSTATAVSGTTLSQSTIGGFLTPQTPAELAAGVTPSKTWYAEGDVRRYGAFLDGVIDDSVAIQRWLNVAGALTYPVNQVAKVSVELTLSSNTHITGCNGGTIRLVAGDKATLRATNKSDITIRGMQFQQTTQWGPAAYVGHITLDGCTNCHILENEFSGHQWSAVYLTASSYCTIRGNYCHDAFPLTAITLTGAPTAGATTGTLTAAWTGLTGQYVVGFIQTAGGLVEGHALTLTNGSTSVTWVGALAANCNAGLTVNPSINSGDINVMSSATVPSSYNVIESNRCFSASLEVGITVQDPYSGVLPLRNIVKGNRVGAHTGYGILGYMPDAGDSHLEIIDNWVEGCTGLFPLNVSAGAGIYCVGNGLGGLVVKGNQVRDCCKNTQNLTLTPAGIGIAGTLAGTTPIIVSGNSVADMSQYAGIRLNTILGGATVSGNAVKMPTSQTGSNIGDAITVMNSDGVSVVGNNITNPNTTQNGGGIGLFANGANQTNIVVQGNTINGGHAACIRTTQVGGFQNQQLVISANICRSTDTNCCPMLFDNASCADAKLTGNFFQGTQSGAVSITGCTSIVLGGANRLKVSGGFAALITSGVCTGGFYDRSNGGVIASATCNNGATGFRVEIEGTAAPAAGTFAIGDTQYNTTPTAAGVFLWVTTTAGAGTWKTISNT